MRKNLHNGALLLLLTLLMTHCAGADRPLVYFPPPEQTKPSSPNPSEAPTGRTCTLTFTSQLCVMLKGTTIEVGTTKGDELCVEAPAFSLHVDAGTAITLHGNEFPDITIEGHGLPVPIIINGKGNGNGADNVGQGTIDAEGHITIQNFSLFVNALGEAAEIPHLTLTTESTDALPLLPAISGSPPDASGAMTLAMGTVLGHLFDAADKTLLGASLTATFAGKIDPTLDQCGGAGGPRSVEVDAVTTDPTSGEEIKAPLADGKRMEISNGTYIAQGPEDVGPRYIATTRFRVTNIGTRTLKLALPPHVGPFFLKSPEPLTRELTPHQSFILEVIFRPKAGEVKAGASEENLAIGPDLFLLTGLALDPAGTATVSSVGPGGTINAANVNRVDVGTVTVTATTQRKYFQCTTITCHGAEAHAHCAPCADPQSGTCQLLPVAIDHQPLNEVNDACQFTRPQATPLMTIDLAGTAAVSLAADRQVLAIRNMGVANLTVRSMTITEAIGSHSHGEFSIPAGGVFVATSFDDIRTQIQTALAGHTTAGVSFPFTLTPFLPGVRETTAYIVVTYQPADLMGGDGRIAGPGSTATDHATLTIATDGQSLTTEVSGETTVRAVPALELYFKTSTGLKRIDDGQSFPFRGVTTTTRDLAIPLLLKLADTATTPLRVVSIAVASGDTTNYQWLDTAEKIAAVAPAAGEGMRCSLAAIDPATGQMVGESFALHPTPINPPGFDLTPGAYSTENMPLFGCVNFHRDPTGKPQRLYQSQLVVTAQELDTSGNPRRNPDGSASEDKLAIQLVAAINPRSGKLVFRVSQTSAVILNPQFPVITSIASREELRGDIDAGRATASDLQIFTGALILDPFDEATITDVSGSKVLTTPGDGVTVVFRGIDTHPISQTFDDPLLYDYANLIFDATRPPGSRGIFEDFPNVPAGMHANGWRIFTTALSYPGPLAPIEKRPLQPSACETVNPCTAEGWRKFTDAGAVNGKGACGFFYASAGRYDSPAFHDAQEMPGGEHTPLCSAVDKPQKLLDLDTGRYTLDGQLTMEEIGLRFFGPTFFHNPNGPLGPVPPLDTVMHTAFTTGVVKPQSRPEDLDVLPDPKIDKARQMYKINLTDPKHANPAICPGNMHNRHFSNRLTSTWTYLAPYISKDEAGTIPAGCPESGNNFTGGTAFFHGRPVDHETGWVTLVSVMTMGASNDLTFAFQDIPMFVVLNGWFCDPTGDEANLEGARCYDATFNDRDAVGQVSSTE